MRHLNSKSKTDWFQKREQILEDEVLSIASVADKLLKRANHEKISEEKAIDLVEYLNSFEDFDELEHEWFFLYDPEVPEEWEKIIDHIYRRSITPNYILN